jgi:hypothetical protein
VRELFVWYRVDERHAEAARAAVAAMHRALVANWPGLQSRLLVRSDAGRQTWMETYARPRDATGHGDGVDAALEAAIATAALPLHPLIDGERHVEAFAAAPSR